MNARSRVAAGLLALILVAGCASTQGTARQPYAGAKSPRPDRIIVHDFAATPADIPAESLAVGHDAEQSTRLTAEEIEVGRKLGAQVAKALVTELQGMGLPAVQAAGQPAPRVGDIVIMGYFEAIDTGSAVKRLVLGFGAGTAELQPMVEGYLMTDKGLRRLGAGEVGSRGGKMPGMAVPLAVAVESGNPIGLIVGGAVKVEGEVTGKSTIAGAAKRTAQAIAGQRRAACQKPGWS